MQWARSIQPKFPEIIRFERWMDRFDLTVSENEVHLSGWAGPIENFRSILFDLAFDSDALLQTDWLEWNAKWNRNFWIEMKNVIPVIQTSTTSLIFPIMHCVGANCRCAPGFGALTPSFLTGTIKFNCSVSVQNFLLFSKLGKRMLEVGGRTIFIPKCKWNESNLVQLQDEIAA